MKGEKNIESVSYKRSLLIGMLLGRTHSKYVEKCVVEFTVEHSSKQFDLVKWKAVELQRLLGVNIDPYRREESKQRRGFTFTSTRRVRIIHKWFHRGQQKAVTPKIRFMDHPIGLAVLLCDVGGVCKRKKLYEEDSNYCFGPTLTLTIPDLVQQEVDLLLNHINSLCGAEGFVKMGYQNLQKLPKVSFNVEESKIIWDYVKQWIPNVNSMLNKFQYIIKCYGI